MFGFYGLISIPRLVVCFVISSGINLYCVVKYNNIWSLTLAEESHASSDSPEFTSQCPQRGNTAEKQQQSSMWRLLSLLNASHISIENCLSVQTFFEAPDRKNWKMGGNPRRHIISFQVRLILMTENNTVILCKIVYLSACAYISYIRMGVCLYLWVRRFFVFDQRFWSSGNKARSQGVRDTMCR